MTMPISAGRARRAAASVLLSFVLGAVVFEVAGRVSYFSRHGMPFGSPASALIYRFYPNLRDVPAPAGETRVLILGGSTLSPGFSDVGARLERGLAEWLQRPVRIINLAMPAQGSLDSFYKYWALRDQPFDLVILYDGINELRTNNVPPALWRDDYGHYAWYEEVNFFMRHHGWTRAGLVLPFYVQHKLVALDRKVLNRGRTLAYNSASSRPEWMAYGATVRSAAPFRANLERTIELARRKGEPVLLMSFAWCIPEDYSLELFRTYQLPYARGAGAEPVEMWGAPPHIRAGLIAHNAVIRDVAQRSGTWFVDQHAALGEQPLRFLDVCHLSPAGAEVFADRILEELRRRWPAPPAAPEGRT
jgi:hypothetical protein